jgi:hypothetical protein
MELIPILSLIILVATISTFVLSVGAYILYKVRERKGITAKAPQPSAIPAELVSPAPLIQEQRVSSHERRTFEIPQQEYGYDYQRQSAYVPSEEQSRGPELRPTFVGNAPSNYNETRYQKPTGEQTRQYESDRKSSGGKGKFMRYTNEGYVEPSKQQERKQEDNLRWR